MSHLMLNISLTFKKWEHSKDRIIKDRIIKGQNNLKQNHKWAE